MTGEAYFIDNNFVTRYNLKEGKLFDNELDFGELELQYLRLKGVTYGVYYKVVWQD